ncbi:hypothetical protein V6U89_29790 [Micromonospora sp. CPCC 206171]|uniref:hypothetical protein n=1 Tax=Micromonospora sp. CPCC 206171 TaxID=3122405 RepID=UPI002FF0B98C
MATFAFNETVAAAKVEDTIGRPERLTELAEWLEPYGLDLDNVTELWVEKSGDRYGLFATELLKRDGNPYLCPVTAPNLAARQIRVRIHADSWPEWMTISKPSEKRELLFTFTRKEQDNG